jgi:phosphate transport system protein
MSMHLQREIEDLKTKILSLSALVEENVQKAVSAIEGRNVLLAEEARQADLRIDEMEVEVEEECLKALALYQPVAVDLRFIVAVLKINNDLERIGDLAVNIADRAHMICEHPPIEMPFDFKDLCRRTLDMLRLSLDALMKMDTERAQTVLALDDEVDDLHRTMWKKSIALMRERPEQIDILLSYLSTVRHLERIADHTTNIAEDVIYMMEGWIVRHGAGPDAEQQR